MNKHNFLDSRHLLIFFNSTIFVQKRCILKIARTEFCPRQAPRGSGREGKKLELFR